MTDIISKNKNRIDVWPSSSIAQEARSGSSKALGRMTVWDSTSEAQGHLSYDDAGGDGGGSSPYAFIGDFKNGTYTVNGASVDVSTVFQNDENDGDPFVPEAIHAGVGYVGPVSGDNGASLAGDALAAALQSATIVFEFTLTSDALALTTALALLVYNAPDLNTINSVILTGLMGWPVIRGAVNNTAGISADLGLAAGFNKCAISYATDRVSVSTNGGAVMSLANPADSGNGLNRITPYIYAGVVIETIKVRSIVADTDLPALSSLS